MIEDRLHCAALDLPSHDLDFQDVEAAARKVQSPPRFSLRKRWVAVALCVLLLMGCAAGAVKYQLWNGGTGDWACTEKTAAKMGLVLPKQFGDSPFLETWKFNLADQGTSWLLALMNPRYQYYGVRYGVEAEIESTKPDGSPYTLHTVENLVSLGFGSTDDPLWRRQFGFDENDAWIGANITIPTMKSSTMESQSTLEYKGQTLYVATYLYDDEPVPSQRVYWVDHTRSVVFRLITDGDTPETVIEYAKQFIDLNS